MQSSTPDVIFMLSNMLAVCRDAKVSIKSVTIGTPHHRASAEVAPPSGGKTWRIGVISASIRGSPQRSNGHTWHFAHGFHPTVDLKAIDVVGVFPDYASAEEAWRGAAQRTVDDAEMRYVIVHLHRLLEPKLPEA